MSSEEKTCRKSQNEIPKKCYDLLTPLTIREQKAMLDLIEKAIAYRNA